MARLLFLGSIRRQSEGWPRSDSAPELRQEGATTGYRELTRGPISAVGSVVAGVWLVRLGASKDESTYLEVKLRRIRNMVNHSQCLVLAG